MVRFDKIAKECREVAKGPFVDVPIVGLEHIEPYDMLLKNWDMNVETTFTKTFKKGQILFGRRRAYQHKACVATCDGICSGDITVIEPIVGAVCSELLPFIVQNDDFFEHAIKGSNGALSPRVKWEHMASFEIKLPSIEQQQVLADKLWAAYEVKQSYLRMIEATEKMMKSQFIEMIKDKKPNGRIADLVDTDIKSVKKSFSKEDTIEYIDISSVDAKKHSIENTTTYIVASAPSRAQQCVQKGDILVSTVRPVNRNIALVDKEQSNLVASSGFCVLRPKDSFKEYLLSVVTSDKFTEHMCDKASGGLYPAVNNGDVLSYEINIPDDSTLNIVSAIYKQADKSEFGGFKSQFIEMFGDKEQNIKKGVLGDFCALKAGKSVNADEIQSDSRDDNYPCYGGNGLRGYVTSYSHEGVYIIIGRQGALCGNVNIAKGRFYATEHAIVVSPKEDINCCWLYYALKEMHLNQYARGVAQPGLAVNQLERLPFGVPSLDRQNKFESIYQQADKSEKVLHKSIETIDQDIKSFINENL